MEHSSNMLDLHHHSAEELHLHPPSLLCWNQHPSLNGAEFVASSSDEHLIDPCVASDMVQDLGLHWTSHGHHSAQQLHLAKIKPEEQALLHDLNIYHLPPPFANGSLGFDPFSSGMFLPGALNIRNSLMPLQTSDQFSRTAPCQTPSINGSPFVDNNINYGFQHHLQGSAHARTRFNLHEMPPSVNGVAENKRGNRSSSSSSMDQLKALKKPRFEHGPSISPFKVRKEKLGDRIAALQQLVAPFGKTDTASVLMEAIGYIKFLQEQVETLSVPYMGPSYNKKQHTTEKMSSDEAKQDLRTRGLCLVPLSCTSYVTNDHAVWSPPYFS